MNNRDCLRRWCGKAMGTPVVRYARIVLAAFVSCWLLCSPAAFGNEEKAADSRLDWQQLPAVPDPIGVAGPFGGQHNGAFILGGGANFAPADAADLWDVPKQYHRSVFVLVKGDNQEYSWRTGWDLPEDVAYGSAASTPSGVVCVGGQDDQRVSRKVNLLSWDHVTGELRQRPLPPLPGASTAGGAAAIGNEVYVVGGQEGLDLASATSHFFRLKVNADPETGHAWESLPAIPGGPRAHPIIVSQHNGFSDCIYVIGGRRHNPSAVETGGIEVLQDCYEFSPERFAVDPSTGWRQRAAPPTPLMAGAAAAVGQSHFFVLAADTGELLKQIQEDPDFAKHHPGFPHQAWSYHTITDTWTDGGETPACPVTTPAVSFDGGVVLASGEVRPRVRSPQVWRITPVTSGNGFGGIDYLVLVAYLLGTVGVGVYFMSRMKDTNDYFRGGQHMKWWAAGCSIFATMLSSITFMSIPAKAYAQDWVYAIGNLMIVVVAPVAVYLALPFFRSIDATSAYEYLERRFNRPVRLFASGLFTMFHVFRMAIVMSLAGLALAVVTPLSPSVSVLLMGGLSILYCTLGGVEAVIWTDTIQTAVLLGGAVLCLAIMLLGSDGGVAGAVATAAAGGKLQFANLHVDPTTTSIALWVILLGGLGQNFSSYTADQAVVQRYMTTPDMRRAATSIWLAAGLAVVATILFFSLGSGLYVFYRAHPEKLDPTFTTDQIFPLFILNETFPGVAGLIVAGIFAAAQSTVSTSMNSTATTVVTDFLRPFSVCRSEQSYLRMARWFTFGFGVLGTMLGLVFINPDIKSLFDSFIQVVGIFMGVLGGLFALGMLTTRATGAGAMIGVVIGAVVMLVLPLVSQINAYLYPVLGVTICFAVGVLASLLMRPKEKNLTGLTVFTQQKSR